MTKHTWYAIENADVLNELNTNANNGLADEEIEKRLNEYGYNELKKEERVSAFTLFVNQFKNVLIIILLIAVVLSFVAGEAVDSIFILVIVVFCAILGFIQEYRAEKALDALKKMLSPTITVLRNGKEEEVPSKELVPGDVLIIEAGDKIPADARIIEAHAMRCDEASLTGESLPVGKNSGTLPEKTVIADRKNMIFAGTTALYGRGKAVVTTTGMNTEFGSIAQEMMAVKSEKTPLEKRTEEVGKWLGIASLVICFLVAAISVVRELVGGGRVDLPFIVTMVMFAVALAVAAVPEALAAIVTGALAIGMRQMAKKNALIRKMPAVETLGCTTVICSDKTGTLTKGEMTVRQMYFGGKTIEVTGVGYVPVGEFKSSGSMDVKGDKSLQMFLKAGVLCNDSDLYENEEKKWFIKGDPTEGSLIVAAAKAGMHIGETRLKNPRMEELPFSSERKRMTTIHETEGGKRIACMKGAPEVLVGKCSHIQGDNGIRHLTEADRLQIMRINEEMAQNALRVLGVAYRELAEVCECSEDGIEHSMIFLGLMGMMDPPIDEVIEATKTCKRVGIRPIMITGDQKLTALAVAKEIGFYREGDMVLAGEELEKISDEEFEKVVDKVSVYARVSTMDKLNIFKAWKKRCDVVAMTGDGVNDAPALKHADIGIAMGITGTEVTKEAADMVLTDDNFATIVKAIELGRWIYDNIKKYLTFLLRCNITEVVVIGGVVLISGPEYLPLVPAAILYINLATDGLPALALGVSPPDPDIMERPPRDPKEGVFTADVLAFIGLALLVEIPFFYFLFYHDYGHIEYARTEMFFLFIIIELVIALNFRSMKYSVLKVFPHKWLWYAIGWELLLIGVLIQFPIIRDAFGINMPTVSTIGLIIGFACVVFILMEVVKAILRKKMQRNKAMKTA